MKTPARRAPKIPEVERRRFARVVRAVRVHASLSAPRPSDLHAEVVDLSLGGVCIKTVRDLLPGTILNLTFRGLRADVGFRLRGRVAWSSPDPAGTHWEAGVELLGLTRDKLEKLLAIVSDEEWTSGTAKQRPYIRLRHHLGVAYRGAGKWLGLTRRHGYTDEVSLRGLILHVEEPLEKSTKLNMHLLLPDGQTERLECFGVVLKTHAWPRPNHWTATVGIEELAGENCARLAAFLGRELISE